MLYCQVPRVVNSSIKCSCQVSAGFANAYNIQDMTDLVDGMECTPAKFTDKSQVVRETADRSKGRAVSLDRPLKREKRTDKNYKFMKGKSLNLGHDTPTQHYSLGPSWLESSFAETNLGILVDTKQNMSQQSSPAVERATHILGHISSTF